MTIPRRGSLHVFGLGISRFVPPPILSVLFASLLCISPAAVVPASATPNKSSKRAEKSYALIYGTVWGPDARPLFGVKVEVRRTDQKKGRWEVYSDHRGEFALRVPPGPADYILWPDLKGFRYERGGPLRLAQEVKVHVDNDEREDVGLHLIQ